jgi:RNA polymerase sigma factor (sigma-70 family)
MLIRVHPHTLLEGDAAMGSNPWGIDTLADLPARLGPCRPTPILDPTRDIIIGAGACVTGAVLWLGGDDWTALAGSDPVPVTANEHAFGVHAAAALTAGEVMKQVLGPLGMINVPISAPLVWNLLDYRLAPAGPVLAANRKTLDVAVFGAGSVGSSANWAGIYEYSRHAMFGTARRFFRTSHEARGGTSDSDVVQEAMAEVMRKGLPTDIDTIERLRAFMAKVTWRRAYNASQRRSSANEPLPRPGSPDEVRDDAFEDQIHDQIIANQAKVLVEQLPDQERHVFREHILKARTQDDVAAEMRVTDARIRQLRTAGLRRLRVLLGVTDKPSGKAASLYE